MEYTVANVKEENRWEEGVYQIEVTDPVVGGVDGISNKQAKQLANRTSYLKEKVDALTPAKIFEEIKKIDGTDSGLDADKLDGLDSSSFARFGQAVPNAALPQGDYSNVGFWRKIDAGWYWYSIAIQGSNNPSPYGFVHVIKMGGECDIYWHSKGSAKIFKLGFNGSTPDNTNVGWALVTSELTTGSYPSTAVMRSENGDFSGRWIGADHFKLKAETQDNLFGNSSELIFRNGAGENENFLRAVSADKFREVLKLFRLDKRNATSVYTASQVNPTIDLSKADNFEIALTGSGVFTLLNGIKGQSGVITLSNAAANITGYASNIKWRTMPTSLQATETFAYFVWHDGYISIGRV